MNTIADGQYPLWLTLLDDATKPGTIVVTAEALERISQQVIATVVKKNHDYGDAWQQQGMPGVACRLSDKLMRIKQLTTGTELMVMDESLRDTLMDAIGYSLLGLLYLDGGEHV